MYVPRFVEDQPLHDCLSSNLLLRCSTLRRLFESRKDLKDSIYSTARTKSSSQIILRNIVWQIADCITCTVLHIAIHSGLENDNKGPNSNWGLWTHQSTLISSPLTIKVQTHQFLQNGLSLSFYRLEFARRQSMQPSRTSDKKSTVSIGPLPSRTNTYVD